MNDVFYVHARICKSLFLLDLNEITHIHNIDAKRHKHDDDNTMYI